MGNIHVMHFHGNIYASLGLKNSFFSAWFRQGARGHFTHNEDFAINCFLLHYNTQLGPQEKKENQNKMTFVISNKISLKGDRKDKSYVYATKQCSAEGAYLQSW